MVELRRDIDRLAPLRHGLLLSRPFRCRPTTTRAKLGHPGIRKEGAETDGSEAQRHALGSVQSYTMIRLTSCALLMCFLHGPAAVAQTATPQSTPPQDPPREEPARRPRRPPPPARDPHTPGYVKAKELPDGALPSPKENGNFVIGPTYTAAPEMTVKEGAPQGRSSNSRWIRRTARSIPESPGSPIQVPNRTLPIPRN